MRINSRIGHGSGRWTGGADRSAGSVAVASTYSCAYHSKVTEYEWDPAKAASNYRKHGIHFADAVGALEDDRAITIADTSSDEERFKTLGTDFLGRLLVVAYSQREERVRLISARRATAPQRAIYEGKRR